MSVAAYERELRRAQRLERFEETLDLDRAVVAFAEAHRQDFPPARPGLVEAVPVDRAAIGAEMKREALQHVPIYKRRERREALEAAKVRAHEKAGMLEAKHLAEARAERAALAEDWEKLCANDPETVMMTLEEAFEDNESPAAPINCEKATATILMRFPTLENVVPEMSADRTPGGRPTVKRRTKTQRNSLYCAALISHVLATAKEAFSVAPGVSAIQLLVIATDDADPQRAVMTPIFYVEFERDDFKGVNWEDRDDAYGMVDRVGWLGHFKGRTEEMVPLDLREEPELSAVVRRIASDLGWRVDPSSALASEHVEGDARSERPSVSPEPAAGIQTRHLTATLGQPIEINDSNHSRVYGKLGPTVRAVVTDVLDPACGLKSWDVPPPGFRLVGARFELENLGPGACHGVGSPAWNSVVISDTGEEFEARDHDLTVATIHGELRVAVGGSRAGYVPYDVRDGGQVAAIQFRVGLFDTAEWIVNEMTRGPAPS
jgi:hypothetical protein